MILYSCVGLIIITEKGNVEAGTTIPFGSITSDTTWTLAGSPYWVEGAVTVEEGVNLTIEPGVVIKFSNIPGIHLHVKGNLTAVGTPGQMIHFTSNLSNPTPQSWGNIWIYSTGNATIEYINVTYGNLGVYLQGASNQTIKNSIFSYNQVGIYLLDAYYNNITNNQLSYSALVNIGVESSNYNIITNNNISYAGVYGIRCANAINNWIYHNNIYDDVDHAYDDLNGNFWNDTYPSGGNYWSHWSPATPDKYSGPITPQITGSEDGICDLQYDIDADSTDFYPLKYPFGTTPDFEPPTIENVNVTPNPQEVYGFVNVSGSVHDNVELGEVWINVTDPGGTSIGNFSMDYNAGDDRYYYNSSYDFLGTYSYTIWANDTRFHWNSSSGSFSIVDSIAPSISNVSIEPGIQDVFGRVNISALCMDNFELFDVWVNITYPNGSSINVTMDEAPGDLFYINHSYDDIGQYDFVIWVNDTNDNWNSSSGFFEIVDSIPPEITGTIAIPGSQDIFGYVNISATVTDNFGLYDVWVNISYPNGTSLNMTMDMGAGNQFYLNQSYDLGGAYVYTIWANDTSNNWNLSSGTFTIGDAIPPEIDNVIAIPDIQEIFGEVNISGTITDNIDVYGAWLNITRPDGSYINVSMIEAAGDLFYVNQSYLQVGVYNFKIWANDTSGNWNYSSGSFTIQDSIPPVIENVIADPDVQEIGMAVNISATVIDNYDLSGIWVNIPYPNGSSINLTMDTISGNVYYLLRDYFGIGIYDFTIWANDTSGNWNFTVGSFMVEDTTPPDISDTIAFPDSQEVSGFVNISAVIIDNYNLNEVWINISYPNGSWINTTMESGTGDIFFLNQSYVGSGLHDFTLWANDTSGNWNSSTGFFIIGDNTPPSIDSVAIIPDVQEVFNEVNISAIITDNYALSDVNVNITYPNGTFINVSMNLAVGDEFYLSQVYNKIGVHLFTIWAVDSGGNWNSSSGFFTIEDNSPPSINNLFTDPDIQNINDNVNISVSVLDNYELFDVWLNINYPDGSYINMTMNKGTGNGFYMNLSYDKVGFYDLTIWANDTSDNWNSGIGSFQIIDPTLPISIIDLISPYWRNDPLIEVSWTASDNTDLSNISLQYRFSTDNSTWGPWIEYTFDNTLTGTTASGSFQFSTSQDGYYEFFVNASDIDGNWEQDPPVAEAIAALDTIVPSSYVAISGYWHTSESLIFNSGTEDSIPSSGIKEVKTYYRFSSDNVSWSSFEEYEGEDSDGYYEFYTIALDNAGNLEYKNNRDTLCAIDNSPPIAEAGDDRTVDIGTIVNLDGTGSSDNFGIISNYTWVVTRDSIHYKTLYGLDPFFEINTEDDYTITLTVRDLYGHENSDTMVVKVNVDSEPPEITHAPIPATQEVLNQVNITASVTDNSAVDKVWVRVIDPNDDELMNVSMTRKESTSEYWHENTYSVLGVYIYFIWANDTSGNWNTSEGSFTVRDSTQPTADAGENIKTKVNKKIIFDGSGSTDNLGIINYSWNISKNGKPIITLYGMKPDYIFEKDGKYEVILSVRDDSGNIGKDMIMVNVEPTGSDLCWLIILILAIIGLIVLFIIWKKYIKKEPIGKELETEIAPEDQSESEKSSEDEYPDYGNEEDNIEI